ncbi:MAG TPA: UDP-N-acetylmuramoyl-tripeptide--D-alanyl-D-alanine ligase [Capillibacterium sp.]
MPEFTFEELVKATAGQVVQKGNPEIIRGVSIDSRTLAPGDVFLAIKGPRFDGHTFVGAAINQGAAAVIIEKEINLPSSWPGSIIKVSDTRQALGDLARFHRLRFKIPVIGVTGSNGKTTTKELIAALLAQQGKVVKTEKNYNNEIGLPLTLFKIDAATKAVVVEMGMRGKGQIAYLAKLACPTVGVITNIGLTHLELLGSQEAIAEAKAELIQALPSSGVAVLNGDDPFASRIGKTFPGESLYYRLSSGDGTDPLPDLFAATITTQGEREEVTADGRWGKFTFGLPLLGRHNVANALAAALVGLSLGLTPAEVAQGLAGVHHVEQRLRKLEVAGITILDDTYNASPASVQAALEVLAKLSNPGRKIAVLGDMLELGPISQEAHRQTGELVAAAGCDALFAYGPLSLATKESAEKKGIFTRHFASKEELWQALKAYLSPGDAVLIKGSRGMAMDEIVAKVITQEREGEK